MHSKSGTCFFSIDNKGLQELNHLHLVYRPPNASVTSFEVELSDKLERDITKPGQITLLCNFIIKMNKPKSANTIIFTDFLESFDLENRVKYTTNCTENTIL